MYNPRLVAKGYAQPYDIDYLETFAPMAKMTIVRILVDFEEEVFMEPLPGFTKDVSSKVCRLKRLIMG